MSIVPEIYVSRMLEKTVVDSTGKRIGRVAEVYADASCELPRVVGLGTKTSDGQELVVPWSAIHVLVREYFYVQQPKSVLEHIPSTDGLLRLKKDLLDRQIVDLNGLKVVRVNDLKMAEIQGSLTLIAADISFRGLLRRLGLRGLVKYWERRTQRELSSALLDWKDIQVINAEAEGRGRLHLSVPMERLRRLHPADLADIIEDLNANDRNAVLSALDPESAADVLQEVEPDVQSAIMEGLPEETASDIIEAMPADEAADILGELDEEKAEQLLSTLDEEDANEVRELMDYEEETVGSLMASDYIAFSSEMTLRDTIDVLRELKPDDEVAYYIYVVDDEDRLEGVVSLRNIVVNPPDTKLKEIMDTNVVSVTDTDDDEMVAEAMDKYGLMAMPVIDDERVLVGVVLLSDVVSEVYRSKRRKAW